MEYQRLELLIGNKELKNLQNKTVLILGVGGVGGYVAEAIARCGIRKLILIDYDIVDITNINRQIVALHSTIGKKKVQAFKERILDINPECEIIIHDMFYKEENKEQIFTDRIDYIADCCDSLKSKESIIREAITRNIKIISSMGAGNKLDPTKFKISKLKNTSYDPLAKKLRYNLRDDKCCLEIPVVYSEEESIKGLEKIASISYMPSICGLLIASYIINDLKGEKNE